MASRPRRINAGLNKKRYDEETYSLISFVGAKKHALVPRRVINDDPIADFAGTIKVRGQTRDVRIIGSGSLEEMHERSSRFSQQGLSEEIDLANECDDDKDDNNKQIEDDPIHCNRPHGKKSSFDQPFDEIMNFDNRTLARSAESTQAATTTGQNTNFITPKNQRPNPRLDLTMLYDGSSRKRKRQSSSSSSSTFSSDDNNNGNKCIDDDENDPIIGFKHIKKGGLRSHLDLARPIAKRRRKIGKKAVSGEGNSNSCTCQNQTTQDRLTKIEDELMKISKLEAEIDRLKKMLIVCRRRLPSTLSKKKSTESTTTTTAASVEIDDVSSQIKNIFNINVAQLRSGKERPTLLIRELFRRSGHVHDWKDMFESHEQLLKNFLFASSSIDETEHDFIWDAVKRSLSQCPTTLRRTIVFDRLRWTRILRRRILMLLAHILHLHHR